MCAGGFVSSPVGWAKRSGPITRRVDGPAALGPSYGLAFGSNQQSRINLAGINIACRPIPMWLGQLANQDKEDAT